MDNHFRLTRGSVAVIDQSFGDADAGGKLRSARQNIGAYGRLNEKFFYNINYSGAAGDAEGEEPANISGLFNVDITDDIMLAMSIPLFAGCRQISMSDDEVIETSSMRKAAASPIAGMSRSKSLFGKQKANVFVYHMSWLSNSANASLAAFRTASS